MTSLTTSASLLAWLQALRPGRMRVNTRERLRIALGAGLGVAFAGALAHAVAPAGSPWPWLIAPMGASAVLVFGLPASPLAQPWAVVGGNTLSALVGVALAQAATAWGPLAPWAPGLAVGLAIVAMFALRCVHPPGGATALLVALGPTTDAGYAFFPVALDSLLLVLAGLAYNSLTGRRYPHAQAAAATPAGNAVDAALERYNQLLDLAPDDLQAIAREVALDDRTRRLAALRCADVMSSPPASVAYGTPLQEAWTLMRARRIKALPVIDPARRVIGIVTLADFLRSADLDLHEGFDARLRRFLRRTPASHASKPEAVGQIMTRQVRVASAERPLADLVPLFSSTGHHHLPVIDGERRLVGMITQSDVVKSLFAHADDGPQVSSSNQTRP